MREILVLPLILVMALSFLPVVGSNKTILQNYPRYLLILTRLQSVWKLLPVKK